VLGYPLKIGEARIGAIRAALVANGRLAP